MINPFLIVDVYLRMPLYHTQLIYICGIFFLGRLLVQSQNIVEKYPSLSC